MNTLAKLLKTSLNPDSQGTPAAAGLLTPINAIFLTATLGVAILQNLLAGRDPQLAILYVLVMVSLAFLGGGKFSLDAKLFSQRLQPTTGVPKPIPSIL